MSSRASILSLLQPSGSWLGSKLRGSTGIVIAAASVFVLIAGIGAATSYLQDTPAPADASRSASHDEALARLKDYTSADAPGQPASKPKAGKMLPDVNTMIEQLAARLETAPDDLKGWRMLGWSYFHTERYAQAAHAYAKAIELDPNSAELKQAHQDALAKASDGDRAQETSPSSDTAAAKGDDKSDAKQSAALQTTPLDQNAAIRSMVDGLADRLERSPRDVEGWTRLMRSRIVLGERDVAASAYRKALAIFKDDTAASAKITEAAIEFGLKTD